MIAATGREERGARHAKCFSPNKGNAAGRSNGDHRMRLTPPTKMTLVVSIVLASLGIVGQFVNMVSNYIPISMFWVAIVAYFVLLLGVLVRGF